MDLREAILKDHSRIQSEIISTYIGSDQQRFDCLMKIVLTDEELVAHRASWVMTHCCEAYPELASPHLDPLLNQLSKKEIHSAIKRNTLRTLQFIEFPPEFMGRIFSLCYDFISELDEAAAVRIYSVTILAKICESEPELADEVELLIRQHLPHASGGFKSRARRAFKDLKKIRSETAGQ